MKRFFFLTLSMLCLLAAPLHAVEKVSSAAPKSAEPVTKITQYGITWTFDKAYPVGQFCTGDYWVLGPVKIVGISNDLHTTQGFAPTAGQDGSMLNPDGSGKQGYDKRLNSYVPKLNVGLPGGKAISTDNPLAIKPGDSLISSVSWLANSNTDKEPGCPRYNGGTKAPRPVTRSAAVLTCLKEAPKPGSFRPAYCGSGKTVKFNKADLKLDTLKNLKPVKSTPSLKSMERAVQRPWIDHAHQYLGAMIHPSENMPQYGQRLAHVLNNGTLMLNLDFKQLPKAGDKKPSKEKLAISMTQIGIDLTGIADAGGSWPANGGHCMGRKLPILLAGVLLDDEHMKNVGKWKTEFQDDSTTFVVSQKEVDMTNSAKWRPDKRCKLTPYVKGDIGMPEWGIRHSKDPQCDNADWSATYRSINVSAFVGTALALQIMEQKAAWNHDVFLAYADRAMKLTKKHHGTPRFVLEMWAAYRKTLPAAELKSFPADKTSPITRSDRNRGKK